MVMRVLFLMVVAAGCGASDPVDGPLKVVVAPELHADAEEAIADWNRCELRQIEVVPSGGVPLALLESSDARTCYLRQEKPEGVLGIGAGDPHITEVLVHPHTVAILEHSLGHVLLGMDHFGTGLMRSDDIHTTDRVGPQECERLRHRTP